MSRSKDSAQTILLSMLSVIKNILLVFASAILCIA